MPILYVKRGFSVPRGHLSLIIPISLPNIQYSYATGDITVRRGLLTRFLAQQAHIQTILETLKFQTVSVVQKPFIIPKLVKSNALISVMMASTVSREQFSQGKQMVYMVNSAF